jgi:hypothetical protein
MRQLLALLLFLLPGQALSDPVCLSAPHLQAATEDERYLAGLVADLRPALERREVLIASLDELAPALCLDTAMSGAEGYFDPETMRIVLARGHTRELDLGILLHEYRHVEQFARGFFISDDLGSLEHARFVFAIEADASAIAMLLAWERFLDSKPDAWAGLIDWPLQSDIAVALAREYVRSSEPAAMAAAAFAQWYESAERREHYYIVATAAYLDRLDVAHALTPSGRLPADFLNRLCLLPEGGSYPCVERDGGRR